jgi:hypothetical protein
MRVGPLEVTPPDAPSYRRLRAKKPSSARTTTMMMIQTMMLKTHLLWYALFCPVVSTVTHSGSPVSRQELERESAIKKRRQRIFV